MQQQKGDPSGGSRSEILSADGSILCDDIWLASWLEVDRHEIRTRLGDRCRRDPLQLAGHSQTWPASLRSKKWLRVEDARPTADAEPGPSSGLTSSFSALENMDHQPPTMTVI